LVLYAHTLIGSAASNKNNEGMLTSIPALAFWLPGAVLSGFGLRKKRSARRQQILLLAVFALALGSILGMAGCGSGHFPSTAPGTYAVQVVGTSGTQQQIVPLTVTIK
jgi:hypothetical protein